MAHYLHLVVSAHVIIRSPLLTYWGEKKKKNPGMYAFLLLKPQSMISSPAAASAS